MKILAIDPSIHNIGVACWEDENLTTYDLSFKQGAKKMLNTNLRHALQPLIDFQPDVLICEYPNFQQSVKGKIAAQQGYVADLAFVVGFIVALISVKGKNLYLPTPNQWKGQTPKDVIGQRYTKWTGQDYHTLSDHQYEAAMMIKWHFDTNCRSTNPRRKECLQFFQEL